MARGKVTFQTITIGQLCDMVDPKRKTEKDPSYQCSNGRTFKDYGYSAITEEEVAQPQGLPYSLPFILE